MTKKKQQEIAETTKVYKDALLAFKLAYLDLLDAMSVAIETGATDEVLYLNKEEPQEEVIIPQTDEEREEVINDIIKEKGDIL